MPNFPFPYYEPICLESGPGALTSWCRVLEPFGLEAKSTWLMFWLLGFQIKHSHTELMLGSQTCYGFTSVCGCCLSKVHFLPANICTQHGDIYPFKGLMVRQRCYIKANTFSSLLFWTTYCWSLLLGSVLPWKKPGKAKQKPHGPG